MKDDELLDGFVSCMNTLVCNNDLSDEQKKGIWKFLLTKNLPFPYRYTDRFADATMGHYAATSTMVALRTELKVKRKQNSIEKIKKRRHEWTNNSEQQHDTNMTNDESWFLSWSRNF